MGIFKNFFLFLFVSLSSLNFSILEVQAFDLYESKDQTELSFTKLESLINEKELTSLEEVLESLKESHQDFFKNYILMYHSRSLQGSSFLNPRAILYDKSGKFVFTFNGNKSQRGYDRLEVMQFKDETRSFEFREITFKENQKPDFSEANPEKCLVCHQRTDRLGVDTRPNWEPYNVWPGAYGSISGNLKLSYYHKNLESLKNADPLILEGASIEGEKIKDFFNDVQPVHPRYKFLDKDSFEPRQTVAFTELQNILGFKRVARIIAEDLNHIYLKINATLAAGVRCGKLVVSKNAYDWLSQNWGEEEFKAAPSTAYRSETFLRHEEESYYYETLEKKGSEFVVTKREDLDFKESFPKVNTSELLHHLFEPLGVVTSDWSLDFKTGGELAFRERFGTPSDTRANFRNAFKEQFRKDGLLGINCSELKEVSVKQFDDFMNSAMFLKLIELKQERDPVDNMPVISRCVSCHESGDSSIPEIPFTRPEDLKLSLLGKASRSSRLLIDEIIYRTGDFAKEEERMPLGPVISDIQRDELIAYLKSLL